MTRRIEAVLGAVISDIEFNHVHLKSQKKGQFKLEFGYSVHFKKQGRNHYHNPYSLWRIV
jgi:hypothetical protein